MAEDRGTHALKGVPEPTALFKLVRASGGGRRSGQRQLTPLVGRDDEMTMLMRRWERARQGDGQLVMIVGEPGLGQIAADRGIPHPASATPRTPGSNGAARSFCKTRRCIRSPNGAGSASAAPTCRRSGGSRSWKARWRRSSSTRRRTCRLLAPLLDIPLPKERAADPGAGGIAPPAIGGADQLGDGGRQGAAGRAGVRGSALGRSDHARCAARHRRARRAGAALHRGDDAARIPPALEHALASRHHLAGAARPRAGARHGGGTFRPPRAAAATWWRTSPRAPAACRCSSRR